MINLVAGHYRTEFSPDGMWKTYFKDNLIAATKETMWNNPLVPFESRQAGEMLLSQTIEITASLDNIIDAKHDEGMEKTDEGDVKDVPSPSDKIHQNDEANVPLTEERLIMIKIQSLLHTAELNQGDGKDVKALFAEIDTLHDKYKSLQKAALVKEYNSLMKQAEQALSNDMDCTAALDRIESIVKALTNGRFS